jgi:hypothetical protein
MNIIYSNKLPLHLIFIIHYLYCDIFGHYGRANFFGSAISPFSTAKKQLFKGRRKLDGYK